MPTIQRERIAARDRGPEIARELLGTTAAESTEHAAGIAEYDGPDVRTCTHCGEHVPFRIDPLGWWAECPACGRLN